MNSLLLFRDQVRLLTLRFARDHVVICGLGRMGLLLTGECIRTGRVPLTHDGEEGGIVVSGRLEVTVDDERRILDPGDAYYFTSAIPHRFRNTGHEPCEIVSASTPPTF